MTDLTDFHNKVTYILITSAQRITDRRNALVDGEDERQNEANALESEAMKADADYLLTMSKIVAHHAVTTRVKAERYAAAVSLVSSYAAMLIEEEVNKAFPRSA